MRTKRELTALGLALAAFYLCFAFLDGALLYPDSEGYITMSVAREPMYPLFLALIRLLFPAGIWMRAAVIVQSLLAAFAAWFFALRLSKLFDTGRGPAWGLALCAVLPSLMCRFLAGRHAMYSNAMLSESLALPLFLVFFTCLLDFCLRGRTRELLLAAGLALLLFCTRKQMAVTLPLLLLAGLWRAIRERRFLARAGLSLALCLAVLLGSRALDRAYNYALRGEAIAHTGDMRFVSTMLFYTATEKDADTIEDGELRGLYTEILALAEQRELTARSAPADWYGRSMHFLYSYDPIQFDCLRDTIEPWCEKRVGGGTALELEKDRVYDAFNAALLPVSLPRLLHTACDSFLMGLVTTVLTMHRLLILPALALYAVYLLLWIFSLRREREAVLGALSLASILGTVALVSLTIFCQSRYTIYNMPMFYASLLLMARGLVQSRA